MDLPPSSFADYHNEDRHLFPLSLPTATASATSRRRSTFHPMLGTPSRQRRRGRFTQLLFHVLDEHAPAPCEYSDLLLRVLYEYPPLVKDHMCFNDLDDDLHHHLVNSSSITTDDAQRGGHQLFMYGQAYYLVGRN